MKRLNFGDFILKGRSKEKELMDSGQYDLQEYAQCLKILFTINKLFGFFRDTVKLLRRFPEKSVLVDIGCGGGLFLLHLNQYFPKMNMLGLDISQDAIDVANQELQHWKQKKCPPDIAFCLQKQSKPDLKSNSVDIVLLTLVCHHLDDDELIRLITTTTQAARKALIINDLHRHFIALWYYRILSPLLFRNRLITHDGLISIRKGFTRKEWQHLFKQAKIENYQIKWRFPFRWRILVSSATV